MCIECSLSFLTASIRDIDRSDSQSCLTAFSFLWSELMLHQAFLISTKVHGAFASTLSCPDSLAHEKTSSTLMYTATHTLAQNYHCEFCCGMHLTRKHNPVTSDRNGSVKRPDKVSRSYHRQRHCRKLLNWKLALPLSTWKLKNRLRKPYRKRSYLRLFENGMVLLG